MICRLVALIGYKINTIMLFRGYVSEVRKKDPKLCYPFTLKDSIDPLCIELPPMVVPKFRWWQCVSCVPEASTSCGVENIESQKPDEVAETSLPLVGESSKVYAPRGLNADTSTSIDSNENRNFLNNVFADPKGKGKAYVEDKPAAHSGSCQPLYMLWCANFSVNK